MTDDGKYTIVNTNDGTLHFYDAESGRKLKELYDTNILLTHKSCPFLKAADLYIVEKGVFDRDLNLISMLPAGGLAAKGADEKSVILRSRYSADTYYKITLLPYDELLKRTDELLKDYAPDRDIREKYNIVSDAEVQ